MNDILLEVNDEEGFCSFAEKAIFEMQRLLREKGDFHHSGIGFIDLCAQMEDLIYNDSLKEYNLLPPAAVWSKTECILYYKAEIDKLIFNIHEKKIKWKKFIEDNIQNPRRVLNVILKDGNRSNVARKKKDGATTNTSTKVKRSRPTGAGRRKKGAGRPAKNVLRLPTAGVNITQFVPSESKTVEMNADVDSSMVNPMNLEEKIDENLDDLGFDFADATEDFDMM